MTSALKKALDTFRGRAQFHDEGKLQAVVKAAQEDERLRIYAALPNCPSCQGTTSQPQIIGGHYMCSNHEWHGLRRALDDLIKKGFDNLVGKSSQTDPRR
jgi:hypothetical protein